MGFSGPTHGWGDGLYTRMFILLLCNICGMFFFYHNVQDNTNRMRYRLLNLNVVKGGFGTLENISG